MRLYNYHPFTLTFNPFVAMRFILFFGLFLVVCCIGCNKGGFSVSGKVTYPDGTPVPRGEVMFTSDSFSAGGHVVGDGNYNINIRVPAGTYRVTVRAMADTPSDPMVDLDNASPVQLLVDSKYNNPETSGLVCEVKGTTTFNITVEAPN